MSTHLDDLCHQLTEISEQNEAQLPPVERWHPELSGDIDIEIKSNGQWLHEGTVIQRQSLVKLFSSILRREDDEYFLVTPVEKWRLKVESYPLFMNTLSTKDINGFETYVLNGPSEFPVCIDKNHAIWVEEHISGPLPIVHCRNRLNAVIARNVYYELAEHAKQNDKGDLGIVSAGEWFSLMPIKPD